MVSISAWISIKISVEQREKRVRKGWSIKVFDHGNSLTKLKVHLLVFFLSFKPNPKSTDSLRRWICWHAGSVDVRGFFWRSTNRWINYSFRWQLSKWDCVLKAPAKPVNWPCVGIILKWWKLDEMQLDMNFKTDHLEAMKKTRKHYQTNTSYRLLSTYSRRLWGPW